MPAGQTTDRIASPPPLARASANDLDEIRRRIEQLDERERDMGKELLQAQRVVSPLIQDLPRSDVFLISPQAAAALAVIRAHDPETYLLYVSTVRQKCGNDVARLIQERVGTVGASGKQRELKLQTVSELLAQPAPEWLVHERWPERGFALIYGESAAGKTFLTLDGALAVSRGEPWFGREVRAGGVIYVAAEGRLRDRVEAYMQAHELSASDFDRFRAIEESVDLSGPTADLQRLQQRVAEAADAIGGVSLVVIDTVARAMAGKNENASEDMGAFIAACREIEDVYRGLVLCVHHSGKDATRGARGHTSLRAALDAEMEVTLDRPSGIRTAKVTKLRDGPDGEAMFYRLRSVALGSEGRPSCVVEPSEAAPDRERGTALAGVAKTALQALQEALGEHGIGLPGTSSIPAGVNGVTLEQWRARFALRYGTDGEESEKRKATAIRQAFRRAREALLKREAIGISDPYVWATR